MIQLVPKAGQVSPVGQGPIFFISPGGLSVQSGEPFELLLIGQQPGVAVGASFPFQQDIRYQAIGKTDSSGTFAYSGFCDKGGSVTDGDGIVLGQAPSGLFMPYTVQLVPAQPVPPVELAGIPHLANLVRASWQSRIPLFTWADFLGGLGSPVAATMYWASTPSGPTPAVVGYGANLSDSATARLAAALGATVSKVNAQFLSTANVVGPIPQVNYLTLNGKGSFAGYVAQACMFWAPGNSTSLEDWIAAAFA